MLQTSYGEQSEYSDSFNAVDACFLPSVQACRTRVILSPEKAIQIFKIKISNENTTKIQKVDSQSVARTFGVSEKAIRDIWNGRTWLREIMHLDPACIAMAARLRPPGRPRGISRSAASNTASGIKGADHSPVRVNWEPIERTVPSPSTPRSAAVTYDNYNANARMAAGCNNFVQFVCSGGGPFPAAEAAPLPESSRADDPFQNDWGHWADKERR